MHGDVERGGGLVCNQHARDSRRAPSRSSRAGEGRRKAGADIGARARPAAGPRRDRVLPKLARGFRLLAQRARGRGWPLRFVRRCASRDSGRSWAPEKSWRFRGRGLRAFQRAVLRAGFLRDGRAGSFAAVSRRDALAAPRRSRERQAARGPLARGRASSFPIRIRRRCRAIRLRRARKRRR